MRLSKRLQAFAILEFGLPPSVRFQKVFPSFVINSSGLSDEGRFFSHHTSPLRVSDQRYHSPYTPGFRRIRLTNFPRISSLRRVANSARPKPQLSARSNKRRSQGVAYWYNVTSSSRLYRSTCSALAFLENSSDSRR